MASLTRNGGGSTEHRPSATQKPTLLVRSLAAVWTGTEVLGPCDLRLEGGVVTDVSPVGRLTHEVGAIEVDGGGLIGMPGLVDCHTHAVWAGTRLGDFVRRLGGEAYATILEGGGGIHTTVAATRGASTAELLALTRARLRGMLAHGVTTVEVKSGYGLSSAEELRILEVAAAAAGPQRVVRTFLGAHTVPRDTPREVYLDALVGPMLDAVAHHCDRVDVYCDRGAFTLAEAERIFVAARARGIPITAHAEQVEHTGVAALAARFGAQSCDHLERADEADIAAMAAAGTVAVLLPGAMLYLRDVCPPVAQLRAAGVPLAVATDYNPGSSPVADLWAAATLAALTMGLSAEEALAGITSVAARALARPDLGRLEPGSAGDLALFRPPPGEIHDPRVLVQHFGGHRAEQVFVEGVRVR